MEERQDLISRQTAIDEWKNDFKGYVNALNIPRDDYKGIMSYIDELPSAQTEQTRIFVELVVEYPDPELCTYKEYRGKPYYSIKYIENGERYVGFGTYKPEVLSQYLKENFISSAQPDRSCIEQIKWERNLAIQQLNELGYSFGEAIRHDKDAISRKGAINAVCTVLYPDADKMNDAKKVLKEMPPAQPDPVVDADKLKRCRFEYINACKIVAHPNPDTSKGDIHDAYAVIKALYPIFGDEDF